LINIQNTLFGKEMSINDIMQLPVTERTTYFSQVENLKLQNTGDGKIRLITYLTKIKKYAK
jgi:hypothetical protein